jgi:hypothetical protein
LLYIIFLNNFNYFQQTITSFNPPKNLTMPAIIHPIEFKLDPATHRLIDPGTTYVYGNEWVVWRIKIGEDIQGFGISGVRPPFIVTLPGGSWIQIARQVSGSASGDWKYKITYTVRSTHQEYSIDPKIAVKSRPLVNIFIIGIPVLVALIILIARQYFIRAKIKIEK